MFPDLFPFNIKPVTRVFINDLVLFRRGFLERKMLTADRRMGNLIIGLLRITPHHNFFAQQRQFRCLFAAFRIMDHQLWDTGKPLELRGDTPHPRHGLLDIWDRSLIEPTE